MAAKLGIDVGQINDAPLRNLVDLLSKIPALVEKSSQAFVNSDGVIERSRSNTNKRLKEDTDKTTDASVAAAKRRAAEEEKANKLTVQASKMSTAQLVDHIFEIQKKKTLAVNAQKAAVADGSKAEVDAQKKVVAEYDSELRVLKQISIERKEVAKEGAGQKIGQHGTGREANAGSHEGGMGIGKVLEVGVALEGLKMLKEKSEEAVAAERALTAGTGQTGKQLEETGERAEEIGKKFAISGESAKMAMGKVASYTGATGPELAKQTEAVVAYGIAHGKNEKMVAKMMATEKGRGKIMAEAELNIAKAQEAASTPAANMQRIQNTLMETIGKLAMVILNSLGPAIQAVVPVVETIGNLLGGALKPILEKIGPVVAMIAKGFAEMAPIIVDLVSGALDLLLPLLTPLFEVLKTMIPVIVDVAKQIGTALKPVFAALTPIIQQLAGVFSGALVSVLKAVLIPVLKTLMPILTDVLVPVLMSLMPLLKIVADIVTAVLTPTLKILTGVINFIVTGAIQPLIKWLSGTLTTTIQSVVGVVTKVAGAISSIVNTVGGLLGMTDKAKEKVKETGEAVGEQEKENAEVSRAAALQEQLHKEQDHKKHLLEMLKLGKINAQELQELKELAAENEDQGLQAKIEAFEKKRAAQAESAGKKAASAAKKTAKEKYDAEKAAADEAFVQEKTDIELALANGTSTREKAKEAALAAQTKHNEALLDIAKKYHTGVNAAQLAALKDQEATRKQGFDDESKSITDREASDIELADGDARVLFTIKKKSLEDQLALAVKYGQETKSLEKAIGSLTLAERRRVAADDKKITGDLAKLRTEDAKARIDQMRQSGKDEDEIRKQEQAIAIKEEEERYADELENRKLDLVDTKLGLALRESLEQNHENKMVAITRRAEAEKRKEQRDTLDKVSGASAVYAQTQQAIHAKFFAPILENWSKQKTFAMQALGTVGGAVVSYFEEWAAKHAAMLVTQLIDSALVTTTNVAAATASAAAWTPAALAASVATLGGAAATGAGAYGAALSAASMIGALADGTDDWRGGPTYVGERGPEILNLPRGSQVIPNHKISSIGNHTLDMSPLLSEMRLMNRTLNNVHGSVSRQKFILPINDNIRGLLNQSEKAEAKRSA